MEEVRTSFRSGRGRFFGNLLGGHLSRHFGGGRGAPPMLKSGPPSPRPPLSSLVSASPRPRRRGSAGAAAFLALAVGFGPLGLLAREADLPLAAIDTEDLHLDLVADLDDFLGAVDLVVGQLRDVQEALQARLELDEDAEVGELGDLALDHVARLVAAGDVGLPRVVLELLEAQGDPLALLVDVRAPGS